MDLLEALTELPKLVEKQQAIFEEYQKIKRELETHRDERYVDIQWVAEYWSVTPETAKNMIIALTAGRGKDWQVKTLRYGQRVVRYRKSDIDRITTASLISVSDMIARKRINRQR